MKVLKQIHTAKPLGDAYKGRRVFLTGATGFKGSWLAWWLTQIGAEVHGYSLAPEQKLGPYVRGELQKVMRHDTEDIRDSAALERAVRLARADFVFHLAAQPIVRASYKNPAETFATNVMGTVHLLEAVRKAGRPCAVVVVTSDKCYENKEWDYSYRENDAMGGFDPYSASKGCAELVTASLRRAMLAPLGIQVATARAGNVIGPGDWAADRIVPDAIRAFHAGKSLLVRNPSAVRPWQHVLEPLAGYLTLGASLASKNGPGYAEGWNFGPGADGPQPVGRLVDELARTWGGAAWHAPQLKGQPHEAGLLRLNIEKSLARLTWRPVWNFRQTVTHTVRGYRSFLDASKDARAIRAIMDAEIRAYERDAAKLN